MPATKEPAMAEQKRIRAKVVCHQYGGHFRGDTVEVDESEYKRVGRWVLLSKEDEDAQRRQAEAARLAQTTRIEEDRSSASGWAEKEAEALRIVRARQIEEQRRQRELLAGTGTP
jgi:hypothetical protein